MAGNSTMDLLSSNDTVDDSTNHPTTKQSITVVLKRLNACDSQQLRSLCSSFGISTLRSQDILIVMVHDHLRQHPSLLSPNGTIPMRLLLNYGGSQSKPLTVDSLTQLGKDQIRSFSDICGIPYHLTKAEFAGMIKNQLLDSASSLVGEGVMVNLQFTHKPSRKETSDISNMSIHINRLEALSRVQLITFCKMFGTSNVKPKSQLVDELRTYLTSNPCAMTEDDVIILWNERPLNSNSSKKTLSKPVHFHRLDTLRQDDIWMICRLYGISTKIPKEQLLERFRTHLHKHPEIIRADGTVDLVALANTKCRWEMCVCSSFLKVAR
ncbi:hypothetical protein BASA83_011273 [Batrachochytrium salamandrivorans]|nr:hypothetical protein BASA83_011273 [Batrachochytrium salamandrivorans]